MTGPSGPVAVIRRRAVSIIGVLVAVIALYVFVDKPLALWARDVSPAVTEVFQHITRFGRSEVWIVPLVVVLPFLLAVGYGSDDGATSDRAKWLAAAAIFIILAIAVSAVPLHVLKFALGRTRPVLLNEAGVYGFEPFTAGYAYSSFPSGHANAAFCVATALAMIVRRARYVVMAIAAVIGFSRVMVHAHYIGDVVGGAALAIATTAWLRGVFADRGLVFARDRRDRRGRVRLAAPGLQLAIRLVSRFRNSRERISES